MADITQGGSGFAQKFHDNGDGTYSQYASILNANPNGQASSANSAPVVLASDQLPQVMTYVKAGKAYMASSGINVTATNNSLNVCGLSLFNPSGSSKTLLVYSLVLASTSSGTPGSLRQTTSDPSGTTGFTNTITPVNLLFGGAASVASASSSPTGITNSVAPTGTLIQGFPMLANTPTELSATNGAIILPPGYGIEVILFINTAGNAFPCTAKWIEY